jgi:hypothetical protein
VVGTPRTSYGPLIVSQLTTMPTRSSGRTFTSIGDLELKALPDMDRALAGRVRETQALAQAWKSAMSGEARLTLLAGEPGIGKTPLNAELSGEAHRNGATVRYGRCDEEWSVPDQPWIEPIVAKHGPSWRCFFLSSAGVSPTCACRRPRMRRPSASADTPSPCARRPAPADKQTLTLLRHVFTNLAVGSSVMRTGYSLAERHTTELLESLGSS